MTAPREKWSPIRISTPVVKYLEEQGVLPPACANVELHIPPRGAMVLRYDVFLTVERALVLSKAFAIIAKHPEPAETP